jgi:hypothetical protein
MPTHVPIILRRRGKFRFPGESCAVHRTIGQVIVDVDTQTAAQLICDDIADLFVGKLPSDATYLNRNHPQSDYQRALRQRQDQEALIRHIISQQPPVQ